MPNYNKKSSKITNKYRNISPDSLQADNVKADNDSKFVKYVHRQAQKKADERTASERFSEIANADKKNKPHLRDADAPVPIKEKGEDTFNKVKKYVKSHKKPRDERSVKHIKPKHLLIILGIICIVMIILSTVSESFRKPFDRAAAVLITPAQKGVNAIGLWLSDKIEAQKTLDELEQENSELKDQIAELTMSVTALKQKESELENVQSLLKMKDEYSDYDMVAAHVVAKDSSSRWFSVFTIDVGTNDGITKDMNVIASGGLVGIVIDAGPNFATVRSIIDDDSSVSAKFESSGGLCTVNGSLKLIEDDLIEFTGVSDDITITNNEAVVTSQISSKYLPGLLIGYVRDFAPDTNDLTQSGHLQPIVDFSNLEEVLVITTLKETSD